jgi:Holliday junction DNA helicase RuvA
MIGHLRGTLLDKKPTEALIDVQGVGYEVLISLTTYGQLPELQQAVSLYTHLLVREDAHSLVAFYDAQERDVFRALIKISGVGPKLALAILSSIRLEEFAQAIQQQDITRLSKIPGIGKKTAERLLIELRDKLVKTLPSSHSAAPKASSASDDAMSALLYLGYSPPEASKALASIADVDQLDSDVVIKMALQYLSR